ncbi:MAG TPA: clan AA aspartic protease [Verrucomicrobiota bacterium]|nr:clan AA aspartic protease [Verrucomicrobiales bacterium]HRI11846.1 clan AA aspartic protease [Verrucomicrobiota bacterium]
MGRVDTKIRLQNWTDIELVALGKSKRKPRLVEVEALADTGAVKLYLRKSVITQLGLRPIGEVTSRTMADRTVKRRVFSPVDCEILGRSCQLSVMEIPDTLPNIVGQIPLEDLDLVVDCRRHKLIPNPAHKEGVMYDEF